MDKQRDMFAVLRFNALGKTVLGPIQAKNSKKLMMLNWIAACFVTEPVGDAVSTAVSVEQVRITIYICRQL